MATKLQFRYFRSVEGKAVARYGSGTRELANQLIGAKRVFITKEARRSGQPTIVWDTEQVVPLPLDWCRQYTRALRNHLKHGDLVEVTEAEYRAYLARREADSSEGPTAGDNPEKGP